MERHFTEKFRLDFNNVSTSAMGTTETFWPKCYERPLSGCLTMSVRSDTDYYT